MFYSQLPLQQVRRRMNHIARVLMDLQARESNDRRRRKDEMAYRAFESARKSRFVTHRHVLY
jgi:hypothetical protein